MSGKDEELKHYIGMKKKNRDVAEPTVINGEIINEYIREYMMTNKIFTDRIPFGELPELQLSFSNIIIIQNLEGLNNLTKLCLDNNIIEKIENLDHLVNLQWLDLSFNKIKEIEGLEELTNLTDLSLYKNNIQSIEGLDTCTKLNVLSLGANEIVSYEPMVTNLLKFKHLNVLNLMGNEVCKDPDYKTYIIAHLKQLKYLDYQIVSDLAREEATQERTEEVNEKRSQQEKIDIEEEAERNKQEELEALEAAFLSTTHNIMESLIAENEEDHEKTTYLPRMQEHYVDYEDEVRTLTETFQTNMKSLCKEKNRQCDVFNTAVKETEAYSEQESVKMIADFNQKKKISVREYIEADSNDHGDEEDLRIAEANLTEVKDSTEEVEENLLDVELALVERLNDAITEFEMSISNTVKTINEKVQAYVSELNGYHEKYFGQIEAIAEEQIKNYHGENSNQEAFNENLRSVLKEKDIINNAISNLKEEHNSKIYAIENEITEAYDTDKNKFIEDFKKAQHLRNRKRCGEIMDVMEDARTEIDDVLNAEYDA